MASRPIFHTLPYFPFYEEIDVDFVYYSGFSKIQKQKSLNSLQSNYILKFKTRKVIDISSKSTSDLGVKLSAFNLKVKYKNNYFPVECLFQGSKTFKSGGPYRDLLSKNPKDAKRDKRLKESGELIHFNYFNIIFPLEPKDYFYNWLYINSLYRNPGLAKRILEFDSFSDIEFNPKRSVNCQARAVAIFVGLSKSKKLEEAMKSKESFFKVVYGEKHHNKVEQLNIFKM